MKLTYLNEELKIKQRKDGGRKELMKIKSVIKKYNQLFSLSTIIRMAKSKMRWMEHVAQMRDMRNGYII
jgi:hypothetical protein